MDAGYPDHAKLLWFMSVPVALLAFWSLVGWLGAWFLSALIVIRRDAAARPQLACLRISPLSWRSLRLRPTFLSKPRTLSTQSQAWKSQSKTP